MPGTLAEIVPDWKIDRGAPFPLGPWPEPSDSDENGDCIRYRATVRYPAFTATAFVRKEESWVRPGLQSPQLLRHEQGHFDIARNFAAMLTRRARSVRGVGVTEKKDDAIPAAQADASRQIDELIEHYRARRDEFNKAYEDDTANGLREEVQLEWEVRLFKRLRRLGGRP